MANSGNKAIEEHSDGNSSWQRCDEENYKSRYKRTAMGGDITGDNERQKYRFAATHEYVAIPIEGTHVDNITNNVTGRLPFASLNTD